MLTDCFSENNAIKQSKFGWYIFFTKFTQPIA